MGDLLSFPNKKKGNAEIQIEAQLNYEKDPKRLFYDLRMQRIMESLNRINELMRQLKENNNVK